MPTRIVSTPSPAKESLYARLFARFYDSFMNRAEKTVLRKRRKALLKEISGRVLEIGSGTGINFPLYSKQVVLLATDPSDAMLDQARARLLRENVAARVEVLTAGVLDPILAEVVPPASIDAVVCTLVLCTVENPAATLAFLHSRLKPGGSLILLEHVRARTKAGRMLQNLLNPVWKRFAHGCNLNRDTEALVKAAGFEALREDYFSITLPFYQAAFQKSAA